MSPLGSIIKEGILSITASSMMPTPRPVLPRMSLPFLPILVTKLLQVI